MPRDLESINHSLSNPALGLTWTDGQLAVQNRISSSRWRLDFPAFALSFNGEYISGDDFTLQDTTASPDEVTFTFRHDDTGIEVRVRYWLEADKPWFRKQLLLNGSGDMPTLDRVWVDLQTDPPQPMRRVGYGLRGGPDAEQQVGLDTYADQPGCGFPVYVGDWFVGLEHASAFTVPGERLELYHHPIWDDNRAIESFPAVFGVAADHEAVPEAFMDYLWHVRIPRLPRPLVTISVGWSTRVLGGGEYTFSWESMDAFLDAMLEIGLKPDAMALDAGYFNRGSLYHGKDDDDEDTKLIALRKRLEENGMKLSLWVSHNGRTGLDMDWIRDQRWAVGDGPGTYHGMDFVVMMQPSFEEALARRFEHLVGPVGTDHLKIDWDNECATNPDFEETYPTPDHVREAGLNIFNRIDRRMRRSNPDLVTRNGWWPSPWWLQAANHVWLVNSGDLEYAAWPSRTQRDRDNTHRDAMYYQIQRAAETPLPFDAYDNHGFADAVDNPFHDEPHTWLDNLVLQFTRGTTYLHMTFCPEALRQMQADHTQAALDWFHAHGDELGTRHTRMVLGHPAFGEIYGYLHESAVSAWLVLRNPSVEPQRAELPLADWLGYNPGTVRQVYPYWQDLAEFNIQLLGHEVILLHITRDQQPQVSPIAGAPFMVSPAATGFTYGFPGNAALSDDIGPTIHSQMQIPAFSAEQTANKAIDGGWRLQWYIGVPHRTEQAELLVTVRGPQEILDALTFKGGICRYKGVDSRHLASVERIFRKETRGYGTVKTLPPVGPRERDDYVFKVPDGGYSSATVDIFVEGAEQLTFEVWLQGYEAPARRTILTAASPADGPLLPPHPYGFSRCLKL